ncbi:hypothetical protein LIER_15415 [Lithospermum erythrorhizon]|uniref:LOB domain-containing protein n=1 Tax=Lithospermum erythrorhizon TaxID=34254 RepID=A0AAV3Q359_LITER
MSCNGCRILRKGCSDNCLLRQSLTGLDNPQAQANATLFVAKFFGRAGLMSFLSSVLESQRPALFQSLLFEACGRTINPVNGAVGLLWNGNWHVCQEAVETVLSGGALRPLTTEISAPPENEYASDANISGQLNLFTSQKRSNKEFEDIGNELQIGLTSSRGKKREATPSEESGTTSLESGFVSQNDQNGGEQRKLLRLFL